MPVIARATSQYHRSMSTGGLGHREFAGLHRRGVGPLPRRRLVVRLDVVAGGNPQCRAVPRSCRLHRPPRLVVDVASVRLCRKRIGGAVDRGRNSARVIGSRCGTATRPPFTPCSSPSSGAGRSSSASARGPAPVRSQRYCPARNPRCWSATAHAVMTRSGRRQLSLSSSIPVVVLTQGGGGLRLDLEAPPAALGAGVPARVRRRVLDQLDVRDHRVTQVRGAHPESLVLLPPESGRQRRPDLRRGHSARHSHTVRVRDLDQPHHADLSGRHRGHPGPLQRASDV